MMANRTDMDNRLVSICENIENGQKGSELYVERGEIFMAKNLYIQALQDAKTAIDIDKTNTRAYILAGRSCIKMKKFTECYEYYKEGLVTDPKNEEITENLKILQNIIIEEYDKSGEASTETGYNAVTLSSQNIYPGDDELFKMESEILSKKYKMKIMDSKKELRVDLVKRKEAATIGVSAHNCHVTGQLQEALHYCTKALVMDETNFRLRQMRAEVYRDMGDIRKAMQDLLDIPKPYRSPEVWKMGGKVLIT